MPAFSQLQMDFHPEILKTRKSSALKEKSIIRTFKMEDNKVERTLIGYIKTVYSKYAVIIVVA